MRPGNGSHCEGPQPRSNLLQARAIASQKALAMTRAPNVKYTPLQQLDLIIYQLRIQPPGGDALCHALEQAVDSVAAD